MSCDHESASEQRRTDDNERDACSATITAGHAIVADAAFNASNVHRRTSTATSSSGEVHVDGRAHGRPSLQISPHAVHGVFVYTGDLGYFTRDKAQSILQTHRFYSSVVNCIAFIWFA